MLKPKILVVDDDPDLVRALRLRLRANNFEVSTASDGYAAIAAAGPAPDRGRRPLQEFSVLALRSP